MAGIDPVDTRPPLVTPASGGNKLLLRIVSSLVLAPLAVAVAYYNGLAFLLFWAVAAAGMLWEWDALVCMHDKNPVFTIGLVALAGFAVLWALNLQIPSMILLGLGLLGVASLASRVRRGWCVAGLVYVGAMLIATLVLRQDPALGFWAIAFLFAVVWCTDVGAYIAGRVLGGPKLIPRVSPNKTWSGALGGTLAGIGGGLALAKFAGLGGLGEVAVVAFALSVVSQAGDLLESAVKRQFKVKDASWLIPGHGGLMDRLDGFVTASIAAAVIGVLRDGLDAPGRGLLVW